MIANNETVTISKERLAELERKELWLSALESAGVDNWEWYGEAQDLFDEWTGEDED